MRQCFRSARGIRRFCLCDWAHNSACSYTPKPKAQIRPVLSKIAEWCCSCRGNCKRRAPFVVCFYRQYFGIGGGICGACQNRLCGIVNAGEVIIMASGGGGRYRGCGLATSCRYGRRRRSDFIGYWQRRDVGKTAMAGIFRRTQNGIGNNVHPRRLPHLFGINHRRQTGNSGANHSVITLIFAQAGMMTFSIGVMARKLYLS